MLNDSAENKRWTGSAAEFLKCEFAAPKLGIVVLDMMELLVSLIAWKARALFCNKRVAIFTMMVLYFKPAVDMGTAK